MSTTENESAASVDDQPVKRPAQENKRVYKGTKTVNHDLYKLQVSEMVKNSSWWSEKPTLIGHEHTHIFHSVDSNGKDQTYSTMTGGHQHKVMYKTDADGLAIPESVEIGPPVRRTKSGDVQIIVQKDAEGKVIKHDNHTHEMIYIQSEEIQVRKKNDKAAKLMAELMNSRDQKLKTSSPEQANTL